MVIEYDDYASTIMVKEIINVLINKTTYFQIYDTIKRKSFVDNIRTLYWHY